jgi:hypothetical protein
MINIRYQHQQTLMKQETNLGGGGVQRGELAFTC